MFAPASLIRFFVPVLCGFGFMVLVPRTDAANAEAEAIVFTEQGGEEREDREIQQWQQRAQVKDAKADAFERLGWAYVAKARRTLDAGYYKLAEKTADAMEARFGTSAGSRLLRGHVLHNLHRFRDAEVVARNLVAEHKLPRAFGLLSDALMEQGKLVEAVEALQQMANLKPGAEVDGRIAQLRWLKGDLPGAISAMESAVRATSPRDAESYAWALTRLAGFYLQDGQTERAAFAVEAALKSAPDFPPALFAGGRVSWTLGKRAEALGALQRAAELNPLPEYQWWLADALRAATREPEAAKIEQTLRARGEVSDARTFALFLATRRESATLALRLAREELVARADPLTRDALAWALATSGDFASAENEMRAALAVGPRDARLLWHAGEIALARGHEAQAREYFSGALPFAATLTPGERAALAGRIGASVAAAEAK